MGRQRVIRGTAQYQRALRRGLGEADDAADIVDEPRIDGKLFTWFVAPPSNARKSTTSLL
jgi:hypothetical protein